MDEGARFPRVAAKAGHYESFYIKACEPGGGRGIWIRHTVHKRPGAEPNASLWFIFFDREAEGPAATKGPVPAAVRSAPAGSWIRVDGAEIGPGRARGAVEAEALKASWELTFSGNADPCRYLPGQWLYEAPVPRTKFVAPCPDARWSGRLELDGDTIELGEWPVMVGHNWGSEHAERWVWLEGSGFDDSPGTYFDAGAARIALGPWTTPWIPSGMLMLDGEAHRLGGFGRIRSARIEESAGACSFVLPGKDVVVPRPLPRHGGGRRRPRLGSEEGLRRLGLRRPEGPRAQHDQLLGGRSRADGGTPGALTADAVASRRRGLRARDARDRPRHPGPALPGRLELSPRCRRRDPGVGPGRRPCRRRRSSRRRSSGSSSSGRRRRGRR